MYTFHERCFLRQQLPAEEGKKKLQKTFGVKFSKLPKLSAILCLPEQF
jgi:hypothetical protein